MNKCKIISGGRCCGKTTKAIKLAYKNNAIILTATKQQAGYIMDFSERIGTPVNSMTFDDFKTIRCQSNKNVVIDQLDWLIPYGLRRMNIIAMTTDLNVKVNKLNGIRYKLRKLFYKLRGKIKHGF